MPDRPGVSTTPAQSYPLFQHRRGDCWDGSHFPAHHVSFGNLQMSIKSGKTLFFSLSALVIALAGCTLPFGSSLFDSAPSGQTITNYAVYYGALDDTAVTALRQFDLVIIHPNNSLGLSVQQMRSAIQRLQAGPDGRPGTADDVKVIAYVSAAEDFRAYAYFESLDGSHGGAPGWYPRWDAIMADPRGRFFNDDNWRFSGPRVDPRGPLPDGGLLEGYYGIGAPAPGSGGWRSYYLHDGPRNDVPPGGVARLEDAGRPDYNINFGAFFVNVGDPEWYETLRDMTRDIDGLYGIEEMLDPAVLGCDGVFLDTIDTMGPNSYTNAGAPVPSEYEWTAAGYPAFLRRLRQDYPDAIVVQNRGLFFFDPRLPHYSHHPEDLVDFVMFESYRLDSSTEVAYTPTFYRENSKRIRQSVMVESAVHGFQVLSLGYDAGPGADGRVGSAEIQLDIQEATDSGFIHYITDPPITEITLHTRDTRRRPDEDPPRWTSTGYVNLTPWPDAYTDDLVPREGHAGYSWGAGGQFDSSAFRVFFDLALDRSPVTYVLYAAPNTTGVQPEDWWGWQPGGPELEDFFARATVEVLTPRLNPGYIGQYADRGNYPVYSVQNEPPVAHYAYVYEALQQDVESLILLRARDSRGNETQNINMDLVTFPESP